MVDPPFRPRRGEGWFGLPSSPLGHPTLRRIPRSLDGPSRQRALETIVALTLYTDRCGGWGACGLLPFPVSFFQFPSSCGFSSRCKNRPITTQLPNKTQMPKDNRTRKLRCRRAEVGGGFEPTKRNVSSNPTGATPPVPSAVVLYGVRGSVAAGQGVPRAGVGLGVGGRHLRLRRPPHARAPGR